MEIDQQPPQQNELQIQPNMDNSTDDNIADPSIQGPTQTTDPQHQEQQDQEQQAQEPQQQPQLQQEQQAQVESPQVASSDIVEIQESNKMDVDHNDNKSKILPELIECRHLLSEFMRRVETEPFNEPVDWKGLNLPDYPLIITKPMDLGTVMNKLTNNKYPNADLFASDIRLVFKNAKTYNTPGSGIYVVAENLHKQFERRFARITKNSVSSKKRKSMDKIKNQQQSTFKDREKFTNLIQTLMPQELGIIVEIIDKKSPTALSDNNNNNNNNNNNDELEIEVYHIDADTLKHLISHCEKLIKNRNKRSRKK